MENPALSVPEALAALQQLGAAVRRTGLPETTLGLVEVRASQINGCSVCLDIHTRQLRALGQPEERIAMVGAWREAPYFTDAERAALALTEAVTRLADAPDGVPDEVWAEARAHYEDRPLAGLVLAIATINAFNRINATLRQVTGDWVADLVAAGPAAVQPA
jgi:AhpD family alkylhydroperoxidase